MSRASSEMELLGTLAEMPFLDRLELAALSGWSKGAVYRSVAGLEQRGLVASVPHATPVVTPTRRYHLTADGLGRLAEATGDSVDRLLLTHPVSHSWLRLLLERLDGAAVIYRLASAMSGPAFPVRFRWHRAAPLDAAVTLPDDRTLGILRLGPTAGRTGFSRRLRRLADGPRPGLVLVIVPDETRLRHAGRLLAQTPVSALLALEEDVALAGPDRRIWRPPTANAALALRYAVGRLPAGGGLFEESPPTRLARPGGNYHDALAALLAPAEKRALDLVADWPWLSRRDLAALMGVSEPRASQVVVSLESHGLLARPPGGSGRIVLTDLGLAVLARRDRASVAAAWKRSSVAPVDEGKPLHWRNVSGGRSRQLLRNLDHTAAVHGFIANLAAQARSLGWEVTQLDPPHRASRHFRHRDGPRSVNPDAFGLLRRGPDNSEAWAFFLEWERRAVRPATMADRLAPYLRYYPTQRPTDDHGVRPALLVVFDDDIAAGHFLRLAEERMAHAGVNVPLWVSDQDTLQSMGPLGLAWRTPGRWEPVSLLPASAAVHVRERGKGQLAGPGLILDRRGRATPLQ
ncbi:MAG: replication-relaxation family protein, partial [Chloroflexota bacterium]|nr:replication-relaxation family protein [Chloroflexota bacterium]